MTSRNHTPGDTYLRKWPQLLKAHTQIPNGLIEHQSCLCISDGELMELIRILKYWFFIDRLPYPSIETLTRLGGKSEAAVIRHINGLVSKGLIERIKSPRRSNKYDPRPLQAVVVEHIRICTLNKQKYKFKTNKNAAVIHAKMQGKEDQRTTLTKNTVPESVESILNRKNRWQK